MKRFLLLTRRALRACALLGLAVVSLPSQTVFDPVIEGTSSYHTVSWDRPPGYLYHLEVSSNFVSWAGLGIIEPGFGTTVTHHFSSPAPQPRMFYRIRREVDTLHAAFLTSPLPAEELTRAEGVPFGFNLDVLPQLPARIKLFRRPWGSSGAWTVIGNLTDLGTVNGVKTVRGSAVWIPTAAQLGQWEVKAEAQQAGGAVIGLATRKITVKADTPPVVTIVSGPPASSANPILFNSAFTVEVRDADLDIIRRVEFYDKVNGVDVLIGIDRTPILLANGVARFGDSLVNLINLPPEDPSDRFTRGAHTITAKAYDDRGNVGVSTAYAFTITGGPARPQLVITSPANGYTIAQNSSTPLTITYQASDPDNDLSVVWASELTGGNVYDSATTANGTLTFSPATLPLGRTLIEVVARDGGGRWSYPRYLEVFVKPSTAPDPFPGNLAANLLNTASVSLVSGTAKFLGVNASSGLFTGGTSKGLEINSGVLLTTGSFALWNQGNRYEKADERQDDSFLKRLEPGDSIVEDRILGSFAADTAVLAFTANCANSQLEMEIQFGSEEYNEYISHQLIAGSDCHNDAFLITVDGVIISLLPDATDIIAANTVHSLITAPECPPLDADYWEPRNEHLFVDNTAQISNPARVEYDGLTVRLRLHAFVQPGQHQIRIAIADTDDENLDSALFIKQSSIRSLNPN